MRITNLLSPTVLACSLFVVGCGGGDEDPMANTASSELSSRDAPLSHDETEPANTASSEPSSRGAPLSHGETAWLFYGGNPWDNRAWLCRVGSNGSGPLFEELDCDLERAMKFALATCERELENALCSTKGCRLVYAPGMQCPR